MFQKIITYCVMYLMGFLLGIIFNLFRLLRFIKVTNIHRIPPKQKNMVVICNHPSLYEVFLIPVLFFKEYIKNPASAPFSTPDKYNFYDRRILFWMRPKAIPIDRKNPRESIRAITKIIDLLNSGKRIILFPEAGRTHKGTQFNYSAKGNRIRKFKLGTALIIKKSNPIILPIWIVDTDKVLPNNGTFFPRFWKKSELKIGQPFKVNVNINKNAINEIISKKLLETSDEDE